VAEVAPEPILSIRGLTVRSPEGVVLHDVSFDLPPGRVTGVIGPSGAGKSTLLRCINRLVDLSPGLRVSGTVRFRGEDVRGRRTDPDELRRRIGMVFQQPVTFPGSVARNVVFAARRLGRVRRREEGELAERCLRAAGLWEEVKDRLRAPATTLSVGQQQRLAIARTLAGEPDVLLMDEPTSALDPRSTEAIEETVAALTPEKTVVLVTHHLEQARRLASWVACICPVDGQGELMEAGFCESVLCRPQRSETRDYLGLAESC
jgi:phosphate transport system ATP-binding protein